MTFEPDPDRATALSQDIRHKLGTSLAELVRACRGVVPLDEAGLRRQSLALRSTAVIRPGAFLLYHECLLAARNDDVAALAPLLRSMATIPVAGPSFIVRNFDTCLPPEEWDRYRRALMTAPDTAVVVISVPPDRFATASRLLAASRALLSTAVPALAQEIDALANEVVLIEDSAGAESSFAGATAFQAWGALLINPRRHPTLVSMANGLVHEAAHALLFALSSGEAMVQNPVTERYASPLRAGKRPMEGIFHASFVSARMHYALNQLLASNALNTAQQEEAARARDAARSAFDAGYLVFKAHGRPTSIGQQAMDSAVGYMLH